MINWFDVPSESPNKDLTLKNLKVSENGTYGESGVAYSSVEVDVSGGGGGSSDFSTAEVVFNGIGETEEDQAEIWAPFLNVRSANSELTPLNSGTYAVLSDNGVFKTEFDDTVLITAGETKTFDFIINTGEAIYFGMDARNPITIVSGNAEIIENVNFMEQPFNAVKITGDCVLNILGTK